MTVATFLTMTLTGSLVLMKLVLMVFAIMLLVRGSLRARHPGAMDPDWHDKALQPELQAVSRRRM
ncbi:MAG: hypothetical protein ABW076_00735 [Candidatus Thiodiazotropha sp.]